MCCVYIGEVDKMNKKMKTVEECEVPVVSEDYLADAEKGAALLKISSHTISSWGAPRHSLPSQAEDLTDFGSHSFKSAGVCAVALWLYMRLWCMCTAGSSKMKLTVKGSSAVDPESGGLELPAQLSACCVLECMCSVPWRVVCPMVYMYMCTMICALAWCVVCDDVCSV